MGEAFGLDVEHYPESAFAAPHTIEKEEFTDPAGSSAPLNDLTGPTAIPTAISSRFGRAVVLGMAIACVSGVVVLNLGVES